MAQDPYRKVAESAMRISAINELRSDDKPDEFLSPQIVEVKEMLKSALTAVGFVPAIKEQLTKFAS